MDQAENRTETIQMINDNKIKALKLLIDRFRVESIIDASDYQWV